MTSIIIIGLSIGGTILILLTLGLLIIAIIRSARTGGISRKDRTASAEETRMIQEIYHGLSKMEERVETLETILMDRSRKDSDHEKTL